MTFTIALISKVMRVNCLICSQISWTEKSWTQYLVIFKKNLDLRKSFTRCIFKLIVVWFSVNFLSQLGQNQSECLFMNQKVLSISWDIHWKNSTSTVVNQWIVWSGSQNWSEWFVYISYNLKRLNIQWYLLKILTSTIAFLDTFLC